MSQRKRYKDSLRRKKRAKKAISELSDIICSPNNYPVHVRNIAVKDLLKLTKRHGEKCNPALRIMFCKACESVMSFGSDSRIRIRKSSVIITCNRCDNKTRKPYRR